MNVLYIHGVNASSKSWEIYREKSKKYRHYKIDLINCNTIDEYNSQILNFMNINKLKSAALVGHSFGSFLAIHFADTYPDKVDKLILVMPVGIFPFLTTFGGYISIYFKFFTHIHNFIHFSLSEQYCKNACFHKLLSLNIPVSLIYGKRDFIVPYKQGIYLKKISNNISLDIFNRKSHFLDKDIFKCIHKRLSNNKKIIPKKVDIDLNKYKTSLNIFRTMRILREFYG